VGLSCGQNISREIAAILGAGVGGVRAQRVKLSARMLPDSAPVIPMKAQTPERGSQSLLFGGQGQPNPFADNFRPFVLLRKLRPQVV